jgi:hypothetical protein
MLNTCAIFFSYHILTEHFGWILYEIFSIILDLLHLFSHGTNTKITKQQ